METLQKQLQDVLSVLHSGQTPPDPNAGILGFGPHRHFNNAQPETNLQRQMKLDFPRFSSSDPTDWLFAVERYFLFYNVPVSERLLVVSFNLDPPASSWFQSLDQDGLLPDWPSLITALHLRFGPTKFEDPSVAIAKLQQTGTMTDYYAASEKLSRTISGLSVTVRKGLFLAGLKSGLRCSVLLHCPQDTHDALAYAKVYEDKFASDKSAKPWSPRSTFSPNPNDHLPPQNQSPATPPAVKTPSNPSTLPIRRLTQAEMQARCNTPLRTGRVIITYDIKRSYNHSG